MLSSQQIFNSLRQPSSAVKCLRSFTSLELLMIMGLIVLLFTVSGLSLASLDKESQLDSLASEIKITLLKAQNQTVNGLPTSIYFEPNRYILFFTKTYTEGDPQNQITSLPPHITLSNINLPNQSVSFLPISGYVKNFTPPENFTLRDDKTGRTRIFNLNRLGLVEIQQN